MFGKGECLVPDHETEHDPVFLVPGPTGGVGRGRMIEGRYAIAGSVVVERPLVGEDTSPGDQTPIHRHVCSEELLPTILDRGEHRLLVFDVALIGGHVGSEEMIGSPHESDLGTILRRAGEFAETEDQFLVGGTGLIETHQVGQKPACSHISHRYHIVDRLEVPLRRVQVNEELVDRKNQVGGCRIVFGRRRLRRGWNLTHLHVGLAAATCDYCHDDENPQHTREPMPRRISQA